MQLDIKSCGNIKRQVKKSFSLNVEHWLGLTEVRLDAGTIILSYVLSRLNTTWALISKGKIKVKVKGIKIIQIFVYKICLIYISPLKINLQWLFYQIWSGKKNACFSLLFEMYVFLVPCWMLSLFLSWELKKKGKREKRKKSEAFDRKGRSLIRPTASRSWVK